MRPDHSGVRVAEYTWWGQLPAHLRTTTQLAALDLPRQPAGPVRATITARNPGTGKKGTWELYDVRESAPTAATGRQLAAAAARRTTSRACAECGARPETPCQYLDERQLCDVCAHTQRLRESQQTLAQERAAVANRASRLLADDRLTVLHLDYTPGMPTPAGNPRPPAAVRIIALDSAGTTLYNSTVRLTGPRTPGAPADALDPVGALDDLAVVLSDRTILIWTPSDLDHLRNALSGLKIIRTVFAPANVRTARHSVTTWRSDLDPSTGELRAPTPPGSADRLLYLLRRMAASAR
ncbi:hypothetical protein AB0D22_35590 [Kitasatospora sp. NPDC048538]|uniref:hypothetical protein n=1 Tax=Kitasatospora sp. NPDC048538 TaxID=3155633 RepID=UPI0033F45DDA